MKLSHNFVRRGRANDVDSFKSEAISKCPKHGRPIREPHRIEFDLL